MIRSCALIGSCDVEAFAAKRKRRLRGFAYKSIFQYIINSFLTEGRRLASFASEFFIYKVPGIKVVQTFLYF